MIEKLHLKPINMHKKHSDLGPIKPRRELCDVLNPRWPLLASPFKAETPRYQSRSFFRAAAHGGDLFKRHRNHSNSLSLSLLDN